jgi:hypothetical protein
LRRGSAAALPRLLSAKIALDQDCSRP